MKTLPRAKPAQPAKPVRPAIPAQTNSQDPTLQGEGNYTAARRHRKSAEAFVASGGVTAAARAAAPKTPAEANELRQAERDAQAPAKR